MANEFVYQSNPVGSKTESNRKLSNIRFQWTKTGGTPRVLSVKYLFGEANIAQNFLLLEDC